MRSGTPGPAGDASIAAPARSQRAAGTDAEGARGLQNPSTKHSVEAAGTSYRVAAGTSSRRLQYPSKNVASVPEHQRLRVGYAQLAMMDNVAYQPGTGNSLVDKNGEGRSARNK